MKREIRIPKQKRSIEKKNNIIKAAYKIFNEKGYHNTNTAEIAKEANLSTGCLYDYFIDKEDIFYDVLKMHNETMTAMVCNKLDSLQKDMALFDIIQNYIYILIEAHNHSEGFHKEVMALSYSNSGINTFTKSYEQKLITDNFTKFLNERNIVFRNPTEKILLFLNTVDSLCHELIYNNNETIDKEIYINNCTHMLEYMLTS